MRRPRRVVSRVLRRGLRPLLPRRWHLPLECWLHSLDPDREPELAHLARIAMRRGVAVDAGANVGYYTYALAKLFERVVAFEPNESLLGPLRAYRAANVEVVPIGLSSHPGAAVLHVPVHGGVALGGWASLEPGNLPGAREHRQVPVRLATLDSYRLEGVDLVKIDVEGHELEVLRGGWDTIRSSRPVLLVEIKEHNFAEVHGLLAGIGYAHRRLHEIAGVPGSREMHVFVPDVEAGVPD